MKPEEFHEAISSSAAGSGVGLDPRQVALLARHMRDLLVWNRTHNLTAITDPGEMARLHYADSLAAAAHLPRGALVADIGTGAGFPGIPLAVARPDVRFLLVESVRKKAGFLGFARASLGLSNVRVANLRIEEVCREKGGGFDVVTARALAELGPLWEMAAPLLVPGGFLLAFKGARSEEEIARLEETPPFPFDPPVKRLRYVLPGETGARCLVFVRRPA
ncbi:MAG: 16S rRNA (guanine(527)-N(7))-methyltransferase RsmG [Desulfatibacillaceae bacterium]